MSTSATEHNHHHGHAHGHDHGHAHGHGGAAAHEVKDPVCGMTVDPATAKFQAEHGGHSYYFCSAKCHDKFVADPAAYLGQAPVAAAPAAAGTIYTCPMHPQIGQLPG